METLDLNCRPSVISIVQTLSIYIAYIELYILKSMVSYTHNVVAVTLSKFRSRVSFESYEMVLNRLISIIEYNITQFIRSDPVHVQENIHFTHSVCLTTYSNQKVC